MMQLPSDTPTLFTGRHFDRLLIIQAVRWYITYKLSYRDSVLADGGARRYGRSYHSDAMGPALYSCVRETVDEICPTHRLVLAS